jgi:hypothetical protein
MRGELKCWGICNDRSLKKTVPFMKICYARFAGRSTKILKNFDPAAGARGTRLPGGFSGRCPGQKVWGAGWRRPVAVGGHTVHRAARSRAHRPHGSSLTPFFSQGPPRRPELEGGQGWD